MVFASPAACHDMYHSHSLASSARPTNRDCQSLVYTSLFPFTMYACNYDLEAVCWLAFHPEVQRFDSYSIPG